MRHEQKALMELAALFGQSCPHEDPVYLSKTAYKLYRMARNIENRGGYTKHVERAKTLASSLGMGFQIEGSAEHKICFLIVKGQPKRIAPCQSQEPI